VSGSEEGSWGLKNMGKYTAANDFFYHHRRTSKMGRARVNKSNESKVEVNKKKASIHFVFLYDVCIEAKASVGCWEHRPCVLPELVAPPLADGRMKWKLSVLKQQQTHTQSRRQEQGGVV
jgi:hypothetical protein